MTNLVHCKKLSIPSREYVFPDLEVKAGEAVAICGQSGSGKSVYLRCLAGLYSEYEGICEQLSDKKAFIFQEGGLLEGDTVFDNLRLCSLFSSPKSDKEIDDALQRFGVLDAKDVVAGNLNRVATKMVQYARADLLEPKIVYIEAPYDNIILEQRRMIRTWLANFISMKKGALIFSTVYAGGWEYLPARIISLKGGDQNAGTIISV
jgi:ABC-type multidrug transport system ATPase subunit